MYTTKRANDESSDSPFMPHSITNIKLRTKVIKQKLCGGISAETPSYFQLKYADVLDNKSRTLELFKGYNISEKNDYKLVRHPELIPQDRKYFNYEDFKSNGSKTIFDYSTLKPSNLIDLLADKRPDFKKTSMFYKRYDDQLKNNGFGLTRGMFTIESNQRYKFGLTHSSRFFSSDKTESEMHEARRKSISDQKNMQKQIISNQAKKILPVQYRSGKINMERYLSNKQMAVRKIDEKVFIINSPIHTKSKF